MDVLFFEVPEDMHGGLVLHHFIHFSSPTRSWRWHYGNFISFF